MKEKLTISMLAVISALSYVSAQQLPQADRWYISPKLADMTQAAPAPIPIPDYNVGLITQQPCTTQVVPNGMYDSNGDLLFYVCDAYVYDYNNSLIGAIPFGGTEVIICPFGNNDGCQRKFSIFTTTGGQATNGNTGAINLCQTVVDMNSFSLSTSVIDLIVYQNDPNREFGAIALSKDTNPNNDRYLYFLGGSGTINGTSGQINQVLVHQDGSVTAVGAIYPTVAEPNYNAGGEIFAQEMDLSPDGKWLAWASFASEIIANEPLQYKYHYIELDNSGGYLSNSYTKFNATGYLGNATASNFRGVEFWDNKLQFPNHELKLFLGVGNDGILYIDIPLVNTPPLSSDFIQVTGSDPVYGYSQIELANNGNMYASSAPSTYNVGAFDPSINSPAMFTTNPSFTLTNPNPPKSLWGTFYTLPDQIDDQYYSTIVPAPVNTQITWGTFNFDAGSAQPTTWTNGNGNNPWNAIINNIVHITQELRISNNSNLTIGNLVNGGMTFKFSPQAKVVIEPGSSLTLDNGTILTTVFMPDPCLIGYTWQGVDVLGVKSLSQNAIPQVQGQLIVKNNSYIEYAKFGARTWDGYDASLAGGMININSGSSFKNCNIDVEFKPYQNFMTLPSGYKLLLGNKSSFSVATFMNDINYPFATAPQHVIIDGCTGIVFSGCTFSNYDLTPMIEKQSIGIKSMNANFTVKSNSTFEYLYHAIDAKRTSGNNNFGVYNSTFIDNQVGVNTDNINNFAIQLNNFLIGGNGNPGATTQVGLVNSLSSGFAIEENDFGLSSNAIGTISKWGILTNSAGPADNEIYNNDFTGLNYGNFSAGINRDNSNPNLHGLQYLCNENSTNSEYDFYISNKGGTGAGIRLFQGTSTFPAGNTFSSFVNGFSSNFYNATNTPLNYYYKSPNNPPYFNSLVIPISTGTFDNACPSHLNNQIQGSLLSNTDVQQLTSEYDSAETAYLNILYTYNSLIDGGNTNAILNQIQQSWSSDAMALRDELLAMSPYLSQEVLREAANRNILPNAMLLMICMANPDATRSDDFLNFLQNEIQNPLPQYMIDLIISSWDDGTARTSMESMLANYSHKMATTSDKILSDLYFKTAQDFDNISTGDTTNYPQQIEYWLNRIQTLTAKYDLIEKYFAFGEVALADQVLAAIPNDFNLSEDQQVAYDDYTYFYQFRKTLYDNGGTLSTLDSVQIATLLNFTEGEENFAKGLAQNALCFYYDLCRETDFEIPASNNRMMHHAGSGNSNEINSLIVAPNPAYTQTTFSYNFPLLKESATLLVCDITGRVVKQFTITNHIGQLLWDTRDIPKGLYFYNVKEGKKLLANGKIAVEK